MSNTDFRKELEHLVNRQSIENGSNTPDFILADYLMNCLHAFDAAVARRERWYGRGPTEVAAQPAPEGYHYTGTGIHQQPPIDREAEEREIIPP